jgi:hypothetical protein
MSSAEGNSPMPGAFPLEMPSERAYAPDAHNNSSAIPHQCPVCNGRTTLLVAIPTPSSLVAYFACESCGLVKIVQR